MPRFLIGKPVPTFPGSALDFRSAHDGKPPHGTGRTDIGLRIQAATEAIGHLATEWIKQPEDVVPLALFLAGQPDGVGLFELDEGEALLIETALPRESRYWSVMLADDQLCTIDWANRQTSLNDMQARVDADGRLRVVIAAEDPGVPN